MIIIKTFKHTHVNIHMCITKIDYFYIIVVLKVGIFYKSYSFLSYDCISSPIEIRTR